jgi:protein involved in sex pheromone biosynthesis
MKIMWIVLFLAACSTNGNQTLILDKEVSAMSRNEVINAITQCEENGTRALMLFAKRKINGVTADVVVDVTCAPVRRF